MLLEWKIFSANNFRGQLSFFFSFFLPSLPHKWQIESKNPLCKHNFLLFVDQIYLLFGVIISKKRVCLPFWLIINYVFFLFFRNVVFFLDSRDLREVHDLVSGIFRGFMVFLNEWTPFEFEIQESEARLRHNNVGHFCILTRRAHDWYFRQKWF